MHFVEHYASNAFDWAWLVLNLECCFKQTACIKKAECDFSFEMTRCHPSCRSQSVHVGAQISNSMSLRGLHSGQNRWTRHTSDTQAPEILSNRQLPRRPASPWPASPGSIDGSTGDGCDTRENRPCRNPSLPCYIHPPRTSKRDMCHL